MTFLCFFNVTKQKIIFAEKSSRGSCFVFCWPKKSEKTAEEFQRIQVEGGVGQTRAFTESNDMDKLMQAVVSHMQGCQVGWGRSRQAVCRSHSREKKMSSISTLRLLQARCSLRPFRRLEAGDLPISAAIHFELLCNWLAVRFPTDSRFKICLQRISASD